MSQTNNTVNVGTLTAAQVELQMAERLVRLKYPNLNIVEGSMIQETAHPLYSNKRRVQIVCGCGCKVERATSDLHTFIGCETCKKQVRKGNKLAKKVAILELLAKASNAGATEPGTEPKTEVGSEVAGSTQS